MSNKHVEDRDVNSMNRPEFLKYLTTNLAIDDQKMKLYQCIFKETYRFNEAKKAQIQKEKLRRARQRFMQSKSNLKGIPQIQKVVKKK